MQTIIIVPCYNESGRLNKEAFIQYLVKNENVAFLFVNDGSKDDTLTMLKSLSEEHSRFFYIDVQPNGGKAEAVRQGMLYAAEQFDCEFIGFWDADLATPLWEIDNFIVQMQRGDFEMVTGLRLMRLGAGVKRKNSRHLLGRCFATMAAKMLQLPVYDTQCGAKLYCKKIVPSLFKESFTTRWLFDVELLSRYVKRFGKDAATGKIYEYPLLEWVDVGGSQLKFKDFFKAPYELWKIKKRYCIK